MRFLSALIATVALIGPAQAEWQLQCSAETCRAFTYTDEDFALRRIRFLVEFTDRAEFTVSALITRDQYRKDYTSNPPTHETFDGQEYVREPNFFGDKLRARIRIDDRLMATVRIGAKGTVSLRPGGSYGLLEGIKHGRELQVQYEIGAGAYATLSFDLTGLQDALSKFRPVIVRALLFSPET